MILTAPHVVVDSNTVLSPGFVAIRRGVIESVGPDAPGEGAGLGPVIDFPAAVISPGMVNVHVHLELSNLRGRLPRGVGFVPWLREMIPTRRALGTEDLAAGVRRGIDLCLAAGTTTVGDISSTGVSAPILGGSGLRGVVFEEAIGRSPELSNEIARSVLERAGRISMSEGCGEPPPLLRGGISPHAPYSVGEALLGRLLRSNLAFPLAVHTSESQDELAMIGGGTGALRALLDEIGVLEPSFAGTGRSPVAWLAERGGLERPVLLVHVNYLEEGDLEVLEEYRDTVSIAFCPRSHSFFGHEPHPLPSLVDRGLNVCLGTDGLSSNDELSLFSEVAEVRRLFPEMSSPKLFEMATVNGARALGFGGAVGELRPGFEADLTVCRAKQDGWRGGVIEALVSGKAEPILTIVAGKICFEARPGDSNRVDGTAA